MMNTICTKIYPPEPGCSMSNLVLGEGEREGEVGDVRHFRVLVYEYV